MAHDYVKFHVDAYTRGSIFGKRTPATGCDMAMKIAREKLESGYIVRIEPYTREEWAKLNQNKEESK